MPHALAGILVIRLPEQRPKKRSVPPRGMRMPRSIQAGYTASAAPGAVPIGPSPRVHCYVPSPSMNRTAIPSSVPGSHCQFMRSITSRGMGSAESRLRPWHSAADVPSTNASMGTL